MKKLKKSLLLVFFTINDFWHYSRRDSVWRWPSDIVRKLIQISVTLMTRHGRQDIWSEKFFFFFFFLTHIVLIVVKSSFYNTIADWSDSLNCDICWTGSTNFTCLKSNSRSQPARLVFDCFLAWSSRSSSAHDQNISLQISLCCFLDVLCKMR